MNNCEKKLIHSFLSKILFYVLAYIYLLYFFTMFVRYQAIIIIYILLLDNKHYEVIYIKFKYI